MIRLQTDDKEFNIASGYDELSLGQYIDIIKLNESREKFNDDEFDIKIISVLSDHPEDLEKFIWTLNRSEYSELTKHFDWVADTTVIDSIKQLKPKPKLKIEGKDYGILSNYNKMSLGEISTFEQLLKQEQSDFHRLDIAFGLLLRPMKSGKLVDFSFDVFKEVIDNKYKVKMNDIYATISFFLSGDQISTTDTIKRFSIHKS